MSSWLDQYKAELANIATKAKATKSKSAFDLAHMVASTPPSHETPGITEKNAWNGYNPLQKILYSDPTTRILDILSRFNYASASMQDELAKQRQDDTNQNWFSKYALGGITDLPKALGAGVEGLEGQSKQTYKDVLDTTHPTAPDWIKSVAGFGLDVGLDPTTYIGAGVVKSVAKKVGIDSAKLPSAVKNTATFASKETDPIKAAKIDLATTGQAVVKEDLVKKVIQEADKTKQAVPTVSPDEIVSQIPVVTPTHRDRQWWQGLVSQGTADNPLAIKTALEAQRANVDQLLSEVKVPKYESGKSAINPEDIARLQKANNPEEFKSIADEIKAATKAEKFPDVASIEAAVKAGRVSKEESTRILGALGNSKSFAGASKYVSSLDKRIKDLSVPDASKLVEDARHGVTAPLNFKPVELTHVEQQQVSHILANTVSKFVAHPAKKFEGEFNAGFNKYDQLNLHNEVMKTAANNWRQAEKAVTSKGQKLSSEQRSAFMYDQYMKYMKASEDTLTAKGIQPVVGKKIAGLPLSMHQVLQSLPRSFVERRMFNMLPNRSAIMPTNFLDAAEIAAKAVISKADPASFRQEISDALMAGSPVANSFKAQVERLGEKGPAYLDTAVDHFVNNAANFAEQVNVNSARLGIKYGQEVEKLRADVIDNFVGDIVDNLNSPTHVLNAVKGMQEAVKAKAVATTTPAAVEQVTNELTQAVSEIVPVSSIQAEAKVEQKFIKAAENVPPTVPINIGNDAFDTAVKEANDLFPGVYDLSQRLEYAQGVRFVRGIAPHIANKDLRPLLLEHEGTAKTLSSAYSHNLTKLFQEYTQDEINQAFKHIQDGTLPVGDRMLAAAKSMEAAMGFVLNLDETGVITRNGINLGHINSKISHFGLSKKYELKGKNYAEAIQSWKNWDNVDDPLNVMSRMYASVQSALADKTLAEGIIKEFGNISIPGERMVTITGQKSILAHLIGTKVQFPESIAKQLHVLEGSIRELARPPSANRMLKLYDSVIHSYKLGLTGYRPAHHMRNLYGDIWLGTMDGVWSPSYYNRAIKVLKTRSKNYTDFNPDLFGTGPLTRSGTILSVKHKGKIVKLNADNVYKLAFTHNVLKDYSIIEDLGVGASDEMLQKSVSEHLKKISPFKGAIHQKVTKISEHREHFPRTAHFIYALEKEKLPQNLPFDQALDIAASRAGRRVQKWHPDGSDYSMFERNVMRRVVLFYGWVRKAIPLVLESMVMTPGRFMVYPKGMAALSANNDIQMNGFGDPFPLDQLFPAWMHEQSLGPQFGKDNSYFGLRTGVPANDIIDQYFTSPSTTFHTIMGGTTPGLKIPFEMATNASARTSSPINKDWANYLLDLVPSGNTVNDLTGQHVGTTAKANIGYKPQFDLPTGQTLDTQGLAGLNWLAGLGITDMSKPSYQVGATLDAKDRARQAAKK